MLVDMLKALFTRIISPSTQIARRRRTHTEEPADPGASALDGEANFRRDMERWPTSAEAHIRLGAFLEGAKRLSEAEAAFRRAIELHADNVLAHYNLGIVLARTNRPLEAEAEYRRALQLLPDFADAHHNLGIVLLSADRIPEAEAAIRRALDLKPDLTEAKNTLGIVLERKTRLAEAEADCRRALAEAHLDLGSVLREAQCIPEAEATFRRATELDRNNEEAHYALGTMLLETQRPWEAEAEYRLALDAKSDFPKALHKLGQVLAGTGRRREAEAAYRRALELWPANAEAHNDLGVLLVEERRLPEAEAAFRLAIATTPDLESAHKNLASLFQETGRLSSAAAAYRRAVERAPDGAMFHYRFGLVLLALGQPDEAAVRFERVLELDPEHARAYSALGVAAMMKGRLEESIACHLRAIALKPDFAAAMTRLGTAYLEKLDFPEATKWNEAALAVEPSQTEANRNLGLIFLKMGRDDEARRHLALASARPPVYIEYASTPTRTVLLLWSNNLGNMPTVEFLFPATTNTRVNWVIQSARDDHAPDLPDYDLVFNATGDSDVSGDSIGPLSAFAAACATPFLNPPDKVERTARNNLPALFNGIDDILVPAVWRFPTSAEWDESLADQLPLLVRPVDSHGGQGLELVRTASELARARATRSGPVYLSRYVDYRSADSWFRKYRVIYVDREPYPLHLAISQNWIVHYFTADMEAHSWKIEEEKRFLENPEAVFGPAGMQALRSIGARMDLDYSGIDFSVLPDGRILVFEANPTMLVHPEIISGPVAHKNDYVFRIQSRFEQMLKRVVA
jgi:tetratricopeptide (TPR) repeat protein